MAICINTGVMTVTRGTTSNALEARKKISEALLQGKINFERHFPGKKNLRGLAEEKKFKRKGFPGKNKLIFVK